MAAPKFNAEAFYEYLLEDPGLPRSNPTASFWQSVPHPLAQHQSDLLPQETDIAIIGSGITGLGVAKTLLEDDSSLRVTTFEARNLCSGATGRNGGQLAINAAETYEEMKSMVGSEMAGKIVRFTIRNTERIRELIRTYNIGEAEFVEVRKLRAFKDADLFESAKRGATLLESEHPLLQGIFEVADAETCVKEHGIHGAVGGLLHNAGTLWPYRMVTKLWGVLLEKYPERLNIETNTPVSSVSYEPQDKSAHHYVVHTNRGSVRASKVAYCVNGYTGHLLPEIRGRMSPLKGTIVVQDLSALVPNRGATTSWAIHYKPELDDKTDAFADGLLYLAQSPKSGYFFFGGEKSSHYELYSSDDTTIAPTSLEFLQDELAYFFGQKRTDKSKLVASWSGIMGFTVDNMPIVGRLPRSLTHRKGNEEWIAAGYNGYGMPNALLAGEALAGLMLGKELDPAFPEAYLVSEERLQESLTTDKTKRLIEYFISSFSREKERLRPKA